MQTTRCNISWFIYFYRRSTCFRRFLRPSSGAQKLYLKLQLLSTNTAACCYRGWDGTQLHLIYDSIGWQYLKLYVQLCAPDDGRRNRLKHVGRLPVAWKRRQCLRFQATGIPATSWVHYTTSCNTQSSAPEDGRDQRPKHAELIGIINTLRTGDADLRF